MANKAAKGVVFGGIAAVMAGCLYGIGGTFSQLAGAAGLTVSQVCFGQYFFATIITGVVVLLMRLPRIPFADAWKLIVLGFCNSFGVFTYYLAIERLSVAAGVAIQFQYVWIAVLIQSVFERVLPGKRTVVSAALILIGTVLGSGMADEIITGGLRMDPLGILAALACACIYASFLYGNTRIAVEHHAIARTFYICLGGLVAVAGLTALTSGFGFSLSTFCGWGAIMAVVGLAAPIACLAFAGSRIDGSLIAILTSTELPMAVISGWLILGEPLTPLIMVGVVVIMAAIAFSEGKGAGAESHAG